MKIKLIIGLLSFALLCHGQTKEPLKTNRYAGVFSFGDDVEKGAVGSLTVYPETDSTILFYLDICRGAPSYNLGQLYSRLKIENDEGIYFSNKLYNERGCKWLLTVNTAREITIKTLDNCNECGFGHAVYVDNHYKRTHNEIPEFFMDGHGNKIYFGTTTPEKYSH